MLGTRKGITPVLSIVLLVLIMVGIVGAAYVFIKSAQEEAQSQSSESLAKTAKSVSLLMSIESIWDPVSDDGNFTVQVRVQGSGTFTSDILDTATAYVDDVPITVYNNNSGDLEPGDTGRFIIAENLTDVRGKNLRITFSSGSTINKIIR